MDLLNPLTDRSFGRTQIIVLIASAIIAGSAFLPGRWTKFLSVLFSRVWISLDKLVLKAYRYFLLEAGLFALLAWTYLRSAFIYSYPVGYAGLYILSSELLGESRFALPERVPYYGPGGMPFAYPPAGFYIAGFFQRFLNIPLLDYVRFAPPVWTLLAVAALYFLARRVLGSRIKAVLAAFLFAATLEIYNYHATAAGMVRGPALLWAMLSLIGIWMVLREDSRSIWAVVLAGAGMALTAMTHLAYLTFVLLTAGLLLLAKIDANFWRRLVRLAIICGLGASLSAPWWATIISRYGLEVFLRASSTHGTFYNLGQLASGNFAQVFLSLFSRWGGIPLLGLTLLGIVYALWRRTFFLPVWFLAVFLIIGESDRFLILIGGLMAAEMIGGLVELLQFKQTEKVENAAGWLLPGLVLVGFIWGQASARIWQVTPSLSLSLEQAAAWLRDDTDSDATYLFFSASHDTAEWLPYISQRVPVIGHWGAEWLGTLQSRYNDWKRLSECAAADSAGCLEQVLADHPADYVLVPAANSLNEIYFAQARRLTPAYKNEAFLIYNLSDR